MGDFRGVTIVTPWSVITDGPAGVPASSRFILVSWQPMMAYAEAEFVTTVHVLMGDGLHPVGGFREDSRQVRMAMMRPDAPAKRPQ